MTDDFFEPLENTSPFVKAALQGKAGTGKTYTGALIAVGLHDRLKSQKPIVVFDTETSSKFLRPFFAERNIAAMVRRSRSLGDLEQTMKRCEEGAADILIIDSITHVWEGVIAEYLAKKKRQRLELMDWGIIKPLWKQRFSDPFVNSGIHIIMTGRAGDLYQSEINEETGKREFYVAGEKMKVEGETAFEPDLLIAMSRFESVPGERAKGKRRVWREASILKDRSTLIDGKVFEQPTYDDFKPVVEFLLNDVREPTPTAPPQPLELPNQSAEYARRERKVMLEEVESLMTRAAPGRSAQERVWKAQVLERAFGSASWTAIQQMSLKRLREGRDQVAAACAERIMGAEKVVVNPPLDL